MGSRLLVAVGVGLLVGGATSLLQTVLPQAVAPLANSAGSWCVAAWWLARPGPTRAPLVVLTLGATLGALGALVGMVAGYYLVADLRGFGVFAPSVAVWLVAAALVAPLLGVAATWPLRTRGVRRVAGALVLPGLLLVEAAYGLVVVRATTSVGYWVAEGVLAVLLAAGLSRRRGSGRVPPSVFADSDNGAITGSPRNT